MAGQKTDARDAYVGQRIAEQRRKASLTQKRVAQSFGMSAAQLQKYEKGTNRISAIHLDTFSRMTGVPVAYFFHGMERIDNVPVAGFSEPSQQSYAHDAAGNPGVGNPQTGNPWAGLAEAVARHVAEHFSDHERRQLVEAVQALDRKLGG